MFVPGRGGGAHFCFQGVPTFASQPSDVFGSDMFTRQFNEGVCLGASQHRQVFLFLSVWSPEGPYTTKMISEHH